MADKSAQVSPMALAKELGLRPQVLYGLIRQDRLKAYENDAGKTVVYRDAALRVLGAMRHRRTSEEMATGEVSSPLKQGQIASYATYGRRPGSKQTELYRQVVQVNGTSEYFTEFRDLRSQLTEFQHQSLRQLIEKGQLSIENPWELLKMVAHQWRLEGRSEQAEELGAFIWSLWSQFGEDNEQSGTPAQEAGAK